jgi:catechol 2,3-dioxygenase-like lactoylglutathione lyase family enzyme
MNLIKQVSHVCFGIRDIEVAWEFYSDVLGFDVVHRFLNESGEIYGLIFRVGNGTYLEFFLDKEDKTSDSSFRHLCFSVANIEELIKRLNKFGYDLEVFRGRTDHTLQCWMVEPNGIKIEFHEYDKKSLLTKFQFDHEF